MDSEKLFFNFPQLPNPQIHAIEWSCSLLHDISEVGPPLTASALKPSNDVIQYVLIMEVWSVFCQISC